MVIIRAEFDIYDMPQWIRKQVNDLGILITQGDEINAIEDQDWRCANA